jgi:dolichol-phosphate mannosyltransferase
MRTVIVPTLNEADNIGQLIESIFDIMGQGNVSVLIVDDDSIDGTQQIVTDLGTRFDSVQLVVRKNKRGLGSAVRLGASMSGVGPVVVMDADSSHDPRFLPAIFEGLEKGFDVVVGSRYAQGGRIVGWPGSRIAASKIATSVARLLFRLPVKDPMSGFVGCRSKSNLTDGFEIADFKFLLEMMVRNPSLRVTETPIVFHDRRRGKSKLGGFTVLLYLGLVFRLFFRREKRMTGTYSG